MGRKGKKYLFLLCLFTFTCCAWMFSFLRAGEQSMFAERSILYPAAKNDVETSPRFQLPIAKKTNSTELRFKGNSSCSKPAKNIALIKTHKTASSSVQNVILRYGVRNHLHFALTNLRGDLRFHYPTVFRSEFVRKSKIDTESNIICHHMRFNYKEVQKIVPEDTRYITILREPGSLFESSYTYFHNDIPAFRRVPGSASIDQYDQYVAKIQKVPISTITKVMQTQIWWLSKASEYFTRGGKQGGVWQFAKSGTFFDLGYNNLNETTEYIEDAIAEMDEIFDLVLIAEYFDVSMILLKELMCWSLDDVVYMKINSRVRARELSPSTVAKVRDWNKADAALYDHFNRTLWEKVEEYGNERMKDSLKTLRELNEYWFDRCVSNVLSSEQLSRGIEKVLHPPGVHVQGFRLRPGRVNDDTCVHLTMTEDTFSNEISLKQDGYRF